jgi:hypothetical protein
VDSILPHASLHRARIEALWQSLRLAVLHLVPDQLAACERILIHVNTLPQIERLDRLAGMLVSIGLQI